MPAETGAAETDGANGKHERVLAEQTNHRIGDLDLAGLNFGVVGFGLAVRLGSLPVRGNVRLRVEHLDVAEPVRTFKQGHDARGDDHPAGVDQRRGLRIVVKTEDEIMADNADGRENRNREPSDGHIGLVLEAPLSKKLMPDLALNPVVQPNARPDEQNHEGGQAGTYPASGPFACFGAEVFGECGHPPCLLDSGRMVV